MKNRFLCLLSCGSSSWCLLSLCVLYVYFYKLLSFPGGSVRQERWVPAEGCPFVSVRCLSAPIWSTGNSLLAPTVWCTHTIGAQSLGVPVSCRACLLLMKRLMLGKPWALFSIPIKLRRYKFIQGRTHPPRVCSAHRSGLPSTSVHGLSIPAGGHKVLFFCFSTNI